jgi:hypothetical protein
VLLLGGDFFPSYLLLDGAPPSSGAGGGITEIVGVGIGVANPMGPTATLTATAASVGADPTGTASAAVSAHEAAPDPHPQYTDAAEAAAAAPVQSVNTLTGNAVLGADDVGADPAGSANAAIAAHVADPDPHTGYLLADGTRSLAGSMDLGGNDLTNGGTVTADLSGNVNDVTLTTGGASDEWLDGTGVYSTPTAVEVGALSEVVAPVIVLVPIAIAGSFAPVLGPSVTAVLPAGTYELHWFSAIVLSNIRGRAAARVQLDTGGGLAPFSDIIGYPAGGNAGEAIAPAEPLQFTLGSPTAVTVQIDARETGAGTATNQRTQFSVTRVS